MKHNYLVFVLVDKGGTALLVGFIYSTPKIIKVRTKKQCKSCEHTGIGYLKGSNLLSKYRQDISLEDRKDCVFHNISYSHEFGQSKIKVLILLFVIK